MKFLKYLFVVMMISCICLTSVRADVTIGSGPGGGYNAGGNWTSFYNNPYGISYPYRGYKIRLVYYDGSDPSGVRGESAWQEITSFDVVVNDVGVPGSSYRELVRLHGNNNTRLGLIDNNAKPNLYWLGQQVAGVENGTTNEDRIRSEIEANDSARLKSIINELGVNESQMSKESLEEMGWNHKGYRFIAEKLIIMTNVGWFFANSRKELAQVIPNDRSTWTTSFYEGLWELRTLANGSGVYPGDIRTTKDDINVRYMGSNWNYDNFRNYNSGIGLGIISIGHNPYYPAYDYSIDAACVNCNSQDAENKAYIIQDTTDWEAIMNSPKMTGNAKTYFDRGNGVYCREEYRVFLPNVNNTINVGTGRYFYVNPSATEMENISSPGIPNFKPIRVTKIRQCRGGDLNAYARGAENEFKQDTGTVTFKYKETNSNSPYNMSSAEEMRRYDDPDSYSATINGNTLTMSVTYSYTLPQNYYQYIRMQDGLSMKRKPTNDSNELQKYINIGLPNLPISFNNTYENTGTSKAGDIQFSYTLPKNSRIAKAYTQSNDYFITGNNKADNIYKKYKNGKMESGDQDILNNSACAKMYGTSGSGFESCVNERTENKIGNCILLNKIDNNNGYICLILRDENDKNKCEIRNGKYYYNGAEITKEDYDRICDPGTDNPPGTPPGDDDCSSEADANRLGRDWNFKTNTCCPVGTSYNPSTGTCENGNDKYTCRIENGKYYDFSGNEITKEKFYEICPNGGNCYVSDGKYYDFNGNEISKEEYDRICPGSTTFKCPESECPYGCCPSGECAPMPDGTCPGTGGINVIYRPIDLKFPFPGQEGSETNARSTGTNWCAYEIAKGRLDCSYDNKISSYYAINKRSEVYTGDALYEVVLDKKSISAVRSYNDDTNYDDWDLKCKDNGKACVSDFLNDVVEVSGLCANSNKSNFYSCDSSKKGSD